MNQAFSLARQRRVSATEIFEHHTDAFKGMGDEVVICCECGQPVQLKGSLGGTIPPYFSHYAINKNAPEKAIPCDSRISGGSREYIKNEQRKHKTYGLSYLIRRLDLYQALSVFRAVKEYKADVIEPVVLTSSGEINIAIDANNFEPARKAMEQGGQLVYKVRQLPEDMTEHSEEGRRYIEAGVMFRDRLGKSKAMRDDPSLPVFNKTHLKEFADTFWDPAIAEGLKQEASLKQEKSARNASLTKNLFSYLTSKGSERSQLSSLVSAWFNYATAAARCYGNTFKNKEMVFTEEDLIKAAFHCGMVAIEARFGLREMDESHHLGMNACFYNGLRFYLDATRAAIGVPILASSTGENPIDNLIRRSMDEKIQETNSLEDVRLSHEGTGFLWYNTVGAVADTLRHLPFSDVFSDILRKPLHIDSLYDKSNGQDGYIYLAHDKALDQIWHKASVKIGKSIDPERRGRELAGQLLPRPLTIHRVWYVTNRSKAESLVFQAMRRKRANAHKEVFHATVSEAIARIDNTLRRSNLLVAS